MDEYQVDLPLNLLPDLESWGMQEVDRGVVEDSSENRAIIRANLATFLPVYKTTGEPTNLIQVISEEMRLAAIHESKRNLLTDPRDPDSDYITGRDLLLELDSDRIVPVWVLAATRRWIGVEKIRETKPMHQPGFAGPPARCAAIKVDNHRCANWYNGLASHGGYCRMHFTHLRNGEHDRQDELVRARHRLKSMLPSAVSELEKLMYEATSEPVRAQAIKEILDRGGLRAGLEIDIKGELEVRPARDEVMERLTMLRNAAIEEAQERSAEEPPSATLEILEAEVVTDDD